MKMITAILKDKKGFTKVLETIEYMPKIIIAVPASCSCPILRLTADMQHASVETIEFYFYRWVDEGIAEYREGEYK